MKSNTILRFGLLPMFLLLSTLAFAQPDLSLDDVTVIKNFDAQLAEADRVEVMPQLPTVDTSRKSQNYFLPIRTLNVDYQPPRIRPISTRGDKLPDAYKGFLKLGAGLPLSLYGEGSFHTFVNKQLEFGIDAFHHSARTRQREDVSEFIENQRFALSSLRGISTYHHDSGVSGQLRAGYRSNDLYFYGYNFDPAFEGVSVLPDDVRQQFNKFDIGASLFNGERTVGDFNYRADFDFYFLNDNYGSRERGYDLKLQGTKWFNGIHSLDLVVHTDFTNFRDTEAQNLNNFFFQPAFTFHGDFFRIKLGANVASHRDQFSFFPDVTASVNILGNRLMAFAGAEGTLQKNNLDQLSAYNPFIVSRFELRNTSYNQFFGGVKGDLGFVKYSGQAGYKRANDMALFLQTTDAENAARRRFNVVYDTLTIVNIQGTLSVEPAEGLVISGFVSQSIFSPRNQERAWHIPSFELNGTVAYTTMKEKLRVRAELYMENGVPYINSLGVADRLNGLFDLSIGADLFFSKNFGAFLQVNNLADNRRQRWQDYPVFGINVLAGINVRF